MEQLTRAELGEALDHARRDEVAAILSALDENQVVGLSGPSEAGKSKLLRVALAPLELAASVAVIHIDLDGVYSPRHLARRWLKEVARATAGPIAFAHMRSLDPDFWPGATRRADHLVREVLLDDYDVVLGAKGEQQSKGGDEEVARALAATDRLLAQRSVLLVFDHLEATELSRALDVRRLLWQVRANSQREQGLRVALVCRPGAIALAADEEGAFYGDGVWMTVDFPRGDVWVEATGGWDGIDELLTLTHGHPWSTLIAADRAIGRRSSGVRRVFEEIALEQRPLVARCVQHAASLHRLGPALLRGLANDAGPYEAIPDALSRDVAAAAQRLALAGITHRPRRGVWQIVNPFVAAGLRDQDAAATTNG